MRRSLLVSVAFGLAILVAFAQTVGGPSLASPAPMPPPSDTPAEKTSAPLNSTASAAGERIGHVRVARSSGPATGKQALGGIRSGHEPGVGESFPTSNQASNITPGDTRSPIAPRLPPPDVGENASLAALPSDALKALESRQSGRAQEALERAETAMLQRSVPADQAGVLDNGSGIRRVKVARDALARGDLAAAKKAVAAAIAAS